MADNEIGIAADPKARWLARLTFLLALALVVVLFVGGSRSIGVFLVALAGLCVLLVAGWYFLSRRGLSRFLAAAAVVAVPVVIAVVFVASRLVWEIVVVLLLAAGTFFAGRAALLRATPPERGPEKRTPPPVRPYVIMNPRSGGGKVGKFDLVAKATKLGATVALIDGPGQVDVAAMARAAVADGADLLGVAGGDGTQALVAGIAADHDLPFLVISAGTRNHFAMDLGLDREHPDQGLEAFTDGVELVLDLGVVGGRTFVNNASFGAYAAIVQSPAYRDDKRGTTLQMLPDLLTGHAGPRLTVTIDGGETIEGPNAILISNNAYELGDPAGLGRRNRIDLGLLGVVSITVDSAAAAAALLKGRHASGLRTLTAHEVVIDADTDEIAVGIDGESVLLPTPVHCLIRPGALRVRVPHDRLDRPVLSPGGKLAVLQQQALSTGRKARDAAVQP